MQISYKFQFINPNLYIIILTFAFYILIFIADMELLGPLKFLPLFKNKIWGGNKINTILHHDYSPMENCGELWAISGIPGNESVVSEGPP